MFGIGPVKYFDRLIFLFFYLIINFFILFFFATVNFYMDFFHSMLISKVQQAIYFVKAN